MVKVMRGQESGEVKLLSEHESEEEAWAEILRILVSEGRTEEEARAMAGSARLGLETGLFTVSS